MSYNQKVWLTVLTVCTLFWLALISGLYTYAKSLDHQHDHGPARTSDEHQASKAPSHSGTGPVKVLPRMR